MLFVLQETAAQTGHDLGIYFTVSDGAEEIPTYIHSKLLIVDDRFLTVGSANATNRSMGLDTELNIAWEETGDAGDRLADSIRAVRMDLLAEHTGLGDFHIREADRLVDSLDQLVGEQKGRLRPHTMEAIFGDAGEVKKLNLDALPFDPGEPIIEENVFELMSKDRSGLIGKNYRPLTDLEMELARVKKDLAEARMERDLLKKAVACFAKESLPGTR
ncbi:MAG: phospholipase D-like domain-containing protein [Nitrospirota bacterium]